MYRTMFQSWCRNRTQKNEEREEVQSDLTHELLDWLQEFRENLVDERSPSEPRANPELGYRDTSISSHTHLGPRLWYLLEDENNEGFLQKTCWYSRAQERNILVTWLLQITKFSVKDVSLDTIIGAPLWYKIWQHSGYNHTRANQILPRRPRRA